MFVPSTNRFLPCALASAFLAFVLLAPAAHAQVDAAVRHFDEGNRRYAAGDYRGALASYREALDQGYASGALYYNMGNAYYRLDETGQAIRFYEKARRLMPERPELLHNLAIARARTVDRFSRLPEPFWRSWGRSLARVTGILFAAGLAGYVLAAVLFGLRIWKGTVPPWQRRLMHLAGTAGLVLLALAFTASVGARNDRQGVVTATVAGLQEAPQTGAPAVVDVHEGLLLDVLQAQDGWLEVRLPNGTTGWIAAQAVAEI